MDKTGLQLATGPFYIEHEGGDKVKPFRIHERDEIWYVDYVL